MAIAKPLARRPPPQPIEDRLYAEGDSYYSPFAIRGYFESFEKAGGNGRLVLFGGLPGNGHRLVDFVPVWKPDADRFLESLGF